MSNSVYNDSMTTKIKTKTMKEILSSHDEIVLSINNDVDGHKQCLLLDEKDITFGVTLNYVYLLHKMNIT